MGKFGYSAGIVLCLLMCSSHCQGKLKTRSSSSALQLGAGTSFTAENTIEGFSGKLIKKVGSSLQGQPIILDEGRFEEEGNKATLTGQIEPEAGRILLDGIKTYQGKRGSVLSSIVVKGLSNRVEGIIELRDAIRIQDSTSSLTVAINSKLPQSIVLNGGVLYLDDDLTFVDDVGITGSGRIIFNKRQIEFGATPLTFVDGLVLEDAQDIMLHANTHLNATWTFTGQSILNGNGNILVLGDLGNIVIASKSSLLLKNISLQNVAGTNIRCLDTYATITMQDVLWIQSDDYTFTVGHIDVFGAYHLTGNKKFIYQSAAASCIHEYSRMVFEPGMTFSYDPQVVASTGLIGFEGSFSELQFDSATLVATMTGMTLTKGKVRFKGNCSIEAQTRHDFDTDEILLDNGIIFGNDMAADDCTGEIAGASTLNIAGGSLVYRNVLADSWRQLKQQSVLRINSGAHLKLYQSLDVQNGTIRFDDLSFLERAAGVQLLGTVDVNGIVGYDTLT